MQTRVCTSALPQMLQTGAFTYAGTKGAVWVHANIVGWENGFHPRIEVLQTSWEQSAANQGNCHSWAWGMEHWLLWEPSRETSHMLRTSITDRRNNMKTMNSVLGPTRNSTNLQVFVVMQNIPIATHARYSTTPPLLWYGLVSCAQQRTAFPTDPTGVIQTRQRHTVPGGVTGPLCSWGL
jgi:hypothetical protein